MIALLVAMVRSRRMQAAVVVAVAALAVAAAVAAPLYVAVAERVVVANDIAAAPPTQRMVLATKGVQVEGVGQPQLEDKVNRDALFERDAPAKLRAEGFTTIFSAATFVLASAGPIPPRKDFVDGYLEFRQESCVHVQMTAGRCIAAPGEVMISEARARAEGLAIGQSINVSNAQYVPGREGEPSYYVPSGPASQLGVVGIYQVKDPAELYWGGEDVSGTGPLFVGRSTLAGVWHFTENQTFVVYPDKDLLTFDRLSEFGERARALLRSDFNASSGAETLLQTIEQDKAAVRVVPGVAALPLVALCWFVLFLAIAHAAQSRRSELGMVKLRGASVGDQWWIAASESFLAVLLGSLLGYALGYVAVGAYARMGLKTDIGVPIDASPLPYAALAFAGGIVAGLLAVRRDLSATATDLLRRVPARGGSWRGVTSAILVLVAAGVAIAQLRANPDDQGGLARLAPALAILGFGLLGAVVVDPLAAWIGGRALRRGRLGLGIGALQVGRRRTGARLVTLVIVATGLLTFAATASAIATDLRLHQASQTIGANQVVSVTGVSPTKLLNAVRAVDPSGAFAMAVVPVQAEAGRALLAVDTPRLSTVAAWPTGGLSVEEAIAKLHPPVDDPLIVRGSALRLTAITKMGPDDKLHLVANLAPLDGSPARSHAFADLINGRSTYETNVGCSTGCMLMSLRVEATAAVTKGIEVTLNALDQLSPDKTLVDAAAFGRWHNRSQSTLAAASFADGLRLDLVDTSSGNLRVAPPDAPGELPVVAANAVMLTLQMSDYRVTTSMAADTVALPRLGGAGLFTDLDYLLRVGVPIVAPGKYLEVWLGPSAPPDVLDQLTEAGLVISGTRSPADVVAASATGPTMLGLRFLLIVAALGVLLGAIGLMVAAGMERRWRSEEARALRVQGLRRGQVLRASMVGYVVVVIVASLMGVAAGAGVWWLTGAYLPLVDARGPGLVIPTLPVQSALVAWGLGAGLLVVLATALAIILGRAGGLRVRGRSVAREAS